MRLSFWALPLVFGSWACAGGQSGTEGEPSVDPCASVTSTPVGLDDGTPAGTARGLFDSLTPTESASLRWFPHDGSSSASDTTLTLGLTGMPGDAAYVVPDDSSCPPRLEVGATLHFETADGAFRDPFSGVAYRVPSGERGFRGALPVTNFSGSYDVAAVAPNYQDPELTLTTTLSPANGSLFMSGASTHAGAVATSASIAEWSGGDAGM